MSCSRVLARGLSSRAGASLRNLRQPTLLLPTRNYASQSKFVAPASLGEANPNSDPATQMSVLSNGLSVASQTMPGLMTSTISLWVDAGSRADKMSSSGAAHFLEHLLFKGTKSRDQHTMEYEIEDLGAELNAYTSREQTCFQSHCFDESADTMVEILADITQNPKLDETAIEREKDVILREAEDVAQNHTETLFDHLHAVAYQNQPLGNTILGPESHIRKMTKNDLESYVADNYTADRMCLVSAGGLEHEQLVKLAEEHFANVKTSSRPIALGQMSRTPSSFTGAEVRVRDDTMNQLHLAIAVEAVGWRHADYWPLQVMAAILGNWDRGLGASPLLSSKLSHIISTNGLANSYQHFFTAYADTGLWGINMITESFTRVDDMVHFTLKEWTRMSLSPSTAEVERAKSQTKAAQLLSLDGTLAISEDIGRQMLTLGRRLAPREIERYIDNVTEEDIKRVAQKYLWDKDIAIAALGQTEGLLDYNRIRADMSSMIA